MCDPPWGVLEEMARGKSKKSCRKYKNKPCKKNRQCGRGGTCTAFPNKKCNKPIYDSFLDVLEETGTNTEMDIEEYDMDLDYGNTYRQISTFKKLHFSFLKLSNVDVTTTYSSYGRILLGFT